jgi:uncharacterized protein
VRPNPVQAPREVYVAKCGRWTRVWPRLKVIDWPEGEAWDDEPD